MRNNDFSDKSSDLLDSDTNTHRKPQDSQKHHYYDIQTLLIENKVQQQALEKATSLIELYREEITYLKGQLQEQQKYYIEELTIAQNHLAQKFNTQNKIIDLSCVSTQKYTSKIMSKLDKQNKSSQQNLKNKILCQSSITGLQSLHKISLTMMNKQISQHQRQITQVNKLIEDQQQKLQIKQMQLCENNIDDILEYQPILAGGIKQAALSKNIISQYQRIIKSYQEYSSLLRAYLCQCIQVIGNRSTQVNENPQKKCFQVIDWALSRTKEKMLARIQKLQSENKQLRYILDEMISTIRKKQLNCQPN